MCIIHNVHTLQCRQKSKESISLEHKTQTHQTAILQGHTPLQKINFKNNETMFANVVCVLHQRQIQLLNSATSVTSLSNNFIRWARFNRNLSCRCGGTWFSDCLICLVWFHLNFMFVQIVWRHKKRIILTEVGDEQFGMNSCVYKVLEVWIVL